MLGQPVQTGISPFRSYRIGAATVTCILSTVSVFTHPEADFARLSSIAAAAMAASFGKVIFQSEKLIQIFSGTAFGIFSGTVIGKLVTIFEAVKNNPNITTEVACRHFPRVVCPRV